MNEQFNSNTLTPYQFDGRNIRLIERDGEIWFVATDVARELGYRDAFNLAQSLDADEKGTWIVSTPSADQEMSIISEPGLYRAIVQRRSNKKHDASLTAKITRFQRWVFHDVLPSIRKTGGYSIMPPAQPAPQFHIPTTLSEALRLAADLSETVDAQKLALEETTPKAKAYDRIAGAEELFGTRITAKLLQMPERKFTDYIQREGWAYRQNGTRTLLCYSDKHKAGLCLNKLGSYTKPDGTEGHRETLKFTAKGVVRLAQKLNVTLPAGDLFAMAQELEGA